MRDIDGRSEASLMGGGSGINPPKPGTEEVPTTPEDGCVPFLYGGRFTARSCPPCDVPTFPPARDRSLSTGDRLVLARLRQPVLPSDHGRLVDVAGDTPARQPPAGDRRREPAAARIDHEVAR